MSKNIEEIVESVLPLCPKGGIDRIHLAQALTEKKLIQPLTLEAIKEKLIGQEIYGIAEYDAENEVEYISISHKHADDLAKAIYERQFKGEK